MDKVIKFIPYAELDDVLDCEECAYWHNGCGTIAGFGAEFGARDCSDGCFGYVDASTVGAQPAPNEAPTLAEREARYGKFCDHAKVTQELKAVFYNNLARLEDMTLSMREAVDMIMHKLGRVCTGDPSYADSWHDIAGYAKLVDDELNGKSV